MLLLYGWGNEGGESVNNLFRVIIRNVRVVSFFSFGICVRDYWT